MESRTHFDVTILSYIIKTVPYTINFNDHVNLCFKGLLLLFFYNVGVIDSFKVIRENLECINKDTGILVNAFCMVNKACERAHLVVSIFSVK